MLFCTLFASGKIRIEDGRRPRLRSPPDRIISWRSPSDMIRVGKPRHWRSDLLALKLGAGAIGPATADAGISREREKAGPVGPPNLRSLALRMKRILAWKGIPFGI